MTVQELLSDESKWCKGSSAVDYYGNPCPIDSPNAVKWCLYGACIRAGGRGEEREGNLYTRIFRAIEKSGYDGGPIHFNDDEAVTFEMVRKVIEEANV
jgi:hypothetical protein